jgi:predicted ferric reductase
MHVGEYIVVLIPSLALTEWHPFTISSAPERTEALTLHVRSLGDWTRRLYAVAQEREASVAQHALGSAGSGRR